MGGARPLHPGRWLGVPALMCVLATIVFAAPIRIYGLQLPEPVFAMVPAFAWALIRPSILAPFALLTLGLFLDIFWGGPSGLWALSLLVAYATALTVMGPDAALAFATAQDLPALIVSRKGGALEERLSPALQAMLDA